MLSYNQLKQNDRRFLAMTGMKQEEFEILLSAFKAVYESCYQSELTHAGKSRQRARGGGARGALQSIEDKLLFILVYQKTNPLQTAQGLQFGMGQPQANFWV